MQRLYARKVNVLNGGGPVGWRYAVLPMKPVTTNGRKSAEVIVASERT